MYFLNSSKAISGALRNIVKIIKCQIFPFPGNSLLLFFLIIIIIIIVVEVLEFYFALDELLALFTFYHLSFSKDSGARSLPLLGGKYGLLPAFLHHHLCHSGFLHHGGSLVLLAGEEVL